MPAVCKNFRRSTVGFIEGTRSGSNFLQGGFHGSRQ
jgi:hypothetical protein